MNLFTAAVVQPVVKTAYTRQDVAANLKRVLTLVENAGLSASPDASHAPVRLVALPEFCIQGEPFDLEFESRKENILITIPGDETEQFARLAKKYNLYIVGSFLELDPKWPDRQFNVSIVISPEGNIILKYRKINPAIHFELTASPHDMLKDYLDDTDKSNSEFLYPVVDTEIGRIGCIICMDGHFPESYRALALNGAEIIVRSNFPEPLIPAPNNIWEIQNRCGAHANMAYVIAPMLGGMVGNVSAQNISPGHSLIIDYNGVIVAQAPYPGESVIGAVINLDQFRARRLTPQRNFLTLLRTESFRDIYDRSILPPDTYSGGKTPPGTLAGLKARETSPIIEDFVKKGIYKKP